MPECRAHAPLQVEKFSRSLDEVTEALKLDENNVKALLRRAKVYCLAPAPIRDVEKATADLNHVLRLEPGNADARAMIANECVPVFLGVAREGALT